jgi:hypothetical protein
MSFTPVFIESEAPGTNRQRGSQLALADDKIAKSLAIRAEVRFGIGYGMACCQQLSGKYPSAERFARLNPGMS